MEKGEETSAESLEQEVFKALDHQRRRDIIRYVGKKKDTHARDKVRLQVSDAHECTIFLRPFFLREKQSNWIRREAL